MKPFDLELAKKGEKVITRYGKFMIISDSVESDLELFMAEDSDFQSNTEKPVYYRGDSERGDEIISALKELGGHNVSGLDGFNKDNVYFIDQFGLIVAHLYSFVKDSIDKFTELHLPPTELHLPPKKVKKEGWMNLVDYGLSKRSCIIPSGSIYDSESEAKEAVKRFDSTLKNFKTIKIGWEEEQK